MAKSVIVYSTNVCPWCVKVKDFLKQSNIAFEERNVKENPAYAEELVQKSGGAMLPVTDIDGTIIVGFNPKKIREAVGLRS